MKNKKCYACGKVFDALEIKKTPHGEWECYGCFSERWEWCRICNDFQLVDWEEPCRHLFYSKGQWFGCGSNQWNEHRDSLFVVLQKVGDYCASAMLRAINRNDFNLQFHGTIFGPYGIWLFIDGEQFGHLFTKDLSNDEESSMSLGVRWLNSLQLGGFTKPADKQTANWISEWLTNRNQNQLIQYFRSDVI